MKKGIAVTLVFLLSAILLSYNAAAQESDVSVMIGPRLGIQQTDAVPLDTRAFAGVDARFQSSGMAIIINPRVSYHFIQPQRNQQDFRDNAGRRQTLQTEVTASILQIGAAALYPFELESVTPYVGGGLMYSRLSMTGTASVGDYSDGVSDSSGRVGLLLNTGIIVPVASNISLTFEGEVIYDGGRYEIRGNKSEGGSFGLLSGGILFSL